MTSAPQPTSPPAQAMTAFLWFQLIVLAALWGGSFFFVAVAVHEIPPLLLVFLRVAIAAAALHLVLLARGLSLAPLKPHAASFLVLALLNNVIPFSLMFLGQTAIGAGLASILNATTPFWTLLLTGYAFRTETPGWNKLAGVAIGIAGVAVMLGPGLAAGLGGPVWAKLALIGTALSYAFASIYARRFVSLPPILVATAQLTAAAIIMIPLAIAGGGLSSVLTASAGTWAAVLGLSLLATSFGYILYFNLIAGAGSSNTMLVTLLVPVSAILLGTLFLGERLETFELAGMALIGTGLIAIDGRLLRRKRQANRR